MEAPVDKHRDPKLRARLNALAAAIFAQHGVDFASARRGGGWTNATWLVPSAKLVLRLAIQPGGEKLRREAQLAALLPPEVGYPPIIATGVTEGHEWVLMQQAPGRNLGEVWPGLDWEARLSALRQLWAKTQAVHSVDPAAAAPLARDCPWFSANAPEAAAWLRSLPARGLLSEAQVAALEEALERYWKALPAAPRVLNHGDLTAENALWLAPAPWGRAPRERGQAGRVTALLDFEFAVIAPVQVDLTELVKMAFAPGEQEDPLPDPGGAGLQRQRELVAELARPYLTTSAEIDLLTGYAILLDQWLLNDWLAHPEGEGPLETWAPYRSLISLADGRESYLKPLLEQLSI